MFSANRALIGRPSRYPPVKSPGQWVVESPYNIKKNVDYGKRHAAFGMRRKTWGEFLPISSMDRGSHHISTERVPHGDSIYAKKRILEMCGESTFLH